MVSWGIVPIRKDGEELSVQAKNIYIKCMDQTNEQKKKKKIYNK